MALQFMQFRFLDRRTPMSTNNNNKDKKSTDTKPKGEVRNINTTTKGLFDYHKEKKGQK